MQTVLQLIKHEDPTVKKTAIDSAAAIIRENLIANFEKLDPPVREKLGILLSGLSPTVIDEISKDLWGDDDQRRLRAVQIIGLLKKNPHIQTVLARLVQDKNEKIRATAVNLLGKFVGIEDKSLILALLNDKDKRVRANTLEALERLGNKVVIPILLRFRNDPNNRIRGNVLKALFLLGYKEIEDDLVQMITANDNFMKASALWVVSQVKISSRCIEDFAGFYLLSENDMVRNNAQKALARLDSARAKGYLNYLHEEA